MNLRNPIVQIHREFFFPDSHVVHLFNAQYLVLHKEVTSSVCISVAILATVIRLFVRRSVLWFDDVSYFHDQDKHLCSPEKLLVETTCQLTNEYSYAR
jgi:hypothetical protein